jgi:hypothetical protein
MRLRPARAGAVLLWLAVCSWPLHAAHPQSPIEDRITVRGAYFREASTRVIQPMMEASKTLPWGMDAGGHFLVDAISSASVAQGVMTDKVFRETRYEGSLQLGITLPDTTRLGAFYRYSTEPDYKSHTAGGSVTREVWQRTGVVGLAAAGTWDSVRPHGQTRKSHEVYFVGASYLQVLGPTTIVQGLYEVFNQRGFISNPYISHANLGRDVVPNRRLRHAAVVKGAQYFPSVTAGLQLHYRFYFDQKSLTNTGPWGMTAHTVEARVHKDLSRDVELRLDYRFHLQNAARFWCNSDPGQGGEIGCYPMGATYHSVDPKFGDATTHVAQGKLIWDTRLFGGLGGAFDLLAGGSFEVSYAYYFENTSYGMLFNDSNAPPVVGDLPWGRSHGGAHLIQTGYSLPF